MSVTRTSRSIVFTAAADAVAEPLRLNSLQLVGTGMTAGQRLTILDRVGGSILADHYVEAANENVEFIQGGPKWVHGVYISAVPAAGTFTIVALVD